MPVIFQSHICRADLRANPRSYYVFGDNLQRAGLGGLARECRGEPNAIGITTKSKPSNAHNAFFSDADYDWLSELWKNEFDSLYRKLRVGSIVIFPVAPLGSGLAALPKVAPRCYSLLRAMTSSIAGEFHS